MRFFVLTMIILLTSPLAVAEQGKQLFESKCSICHSLERALSRTKDIDAWRRTIKRMTRYAAQAGKSISGDDAEDIAMYLAFRGGKKEIEVAEKEEAEVEKIVEIEKHEMFNFKKLRSGQFVDSEVCEGCHSQQFKEWNGSMHSKAFVDPLWREATKLFYSEAKSSDEIIELKACVKCHIPLGFRSYLISSPAEDYDKVKGIPAQGIFCNWCHTISEVKHLGDAGYEVQPGGGEDDPSTMLGPFKDASSDFHPTKYSELHTKAEFCGLCHNVSHAANRLPLEQTYNEWANSPYNTGSPETSVKCQDCHMRQRPGVPSTGKTERPDNPGKACDMGPDREHIWTHYFVGGNAITTKLLGSNMHADMAVERLKHAADLKVIRNSNYRKKGLANIKIKVINSGAGHYLPTGLTEIRQMWLDVKITDDRGRVLLRSGGIDDQGNIDSEAVIYHTKLGDKNGRPVLNVAKADRVLLDKRIPPKGYAIEKYSFYIPDNVAFPLKVRATLKYRSVSQSVADKLLGKDSPEIPVINMVSIEESL